MRIHNVLVAACSLAGVVPPGCPRSTDARMSTDVPSIIVGGGRIGSLLADLGVEGDAVLTRSMPFPSSPAEGPIYVCTRNDALESIVEATPEHRRKDLVFMQNGMLESFLADNSLADATQVLLYLAVAKLGEAPIDGITDTNPDGLTTAKGKWAETFAARLASGELTCRLLDGDEYTKAMLEKHVWICAFMMTGALNGGVTVGAVEAEHSAQLKALVNELCAAGEGALGVTLEDGVYERLGSHGVYERLTAYGRSVAHFPTAVKEFEWRNGWFYELTKAALAAGRPDPMPLHTAGLKTLGVVEA